MFEETFDNNPVVETEKKKKKKFDRIVNTHTKEDQK